MATKDSIGDLQKQIADLQRELWRLTGRYVGPTEPVEQADYVKHGSDRHAAMLGLKKASDKDKFTSNGWAFQDPTQWGPTARDDFIQVQLEQRVSELTAPLPQYQSSDPREPFFAPVMWRPGQPFSQMTE